MQKTNLDLTYRSLLMNSYQLQQQREQRKEVRIISIYNHRLFRRNGVDKVQRDYPQVLGEGGESLWSVGRKPHRPKTGSGDRLLDIPCKVNLSAKKSKLKKCFLKIFRIGAWLFVAEIKIIPCKVNLSCNKLTLKKCFCNIFRIGAWSFVAEIKIVFSELVSWW